MTSKVLCVCSVIRDDLISEVFVSATTKDYAACGMIQNCRDPCVVGDNEGAPACSQSS